MRRVRTTPRFLDLFFILNTKLFYLGHVISRMFFWNSKNKKPVFVPSYKDTVDYLQLTKTYLIDKLGYDIKYLSPNFRLEDSAPEWFKDLHLAVSRKLYKLF